MMLEDIADLLIDTRDQVGAINAIEQKGEKSEVDPMSKIEMFAGSLDAM